MLVQRSSYILLIWWLRPLNRFVFPKGAYHSTIYCCSLEFMGLPKDLLQNLLGLSECCGILHLRTGSNLNLTLCES